MKHCSECKTEITKDNQKITNKKYVNKLCKFCYQKKYHSSFQSLKTWCPKVKNKTKFMTSYGTEIFL